MWGNVGKCGERGYLVGVNLVRPNSELVGSSGGKGRMHIPNREEEKLETMRHKSDVNLTVTDFHLKSLKGSLTMKRIFILQIFIVISHTTSETLRREPSNVRGLYTLENHLNDHEIIIPRKVSHKGELISHNVSHHHDEDGSEVHYRLAVAGKEYHIELTAVEDFIGSSMIVERHKRDFHIRTSPKNHSTKCHYRGFIRNHPNSRVALSACDGLVSFSFSCLIKFYFKYIK
ncbi:hypothetical protein M0802_016537 [Mischocyttarus mexicanus]|nr:hypothetical protein M0802_016537 [Mischocyttarus mexicanus]